MRDRRIIAVAGLAAALSAPLLAVPVTRDQLAAMAREKVDPAVIRAIVERDCVDFDVDAANAPELSKILPAGVLEAAIECRKRAATDREAPAPAPAVASAPAIASSAATPAPAPATGGVAASRPQMAAPVPAVAAAAELRLRAIFIAESAALGCACSLDGRPVASLVKEAQGEFGQAVERAKIKRESGYLSASAGPHVVEFQCDPGAQKVKVDIDLPAGGRRTVEIRESALRRWKLGRVEEK